MVESPTEDQVVAVRLLPWGTKIFIKTKYLYMTNANELMVQLKLPKKLEECLNYLENISGASKEFIFLEALYQYFEEIEDIETLSIWEYLGILKRGNPTKKESLYTREEARKRLKKI